MNIVFFHEQLFAFMFKLLDLNSLHVNHIVIFSKIKHKVSTSQFFCKVLLIFFKNWLLFKSNDHLKKFCACFNNCQPSMCFSFEKKQNGQMSLPNYRILQENGKFVAFGYLKTVFSGIYTHYAFYKQSWYFLYLSFTLYSD